MSVVLPIPGSPATQAIARAAATRALPSALKAREHRGAADESARCRADAAADAATSGDRSRCRDTVPRSRLLQRHGTRDEPITATRHRFYEAWAPRIVAKNRSDVADRALQHRVADEAVAPDLVEQRVLRQQRAGMANESAEQAERRRRERDRATAAQQQRIRLVELELAEADAHGRTSVEEEATRQVRILRCEPESSMLARCVHDAKHGPSDR